MKKFSFVLMLVFADIFSYGQTVSVRGIVKDSQGQPVPMAFIRDVAHSYAAYTDSSGTFQLKVDPKSALKIIAINFKDQQVSLNGKQEISVVLEGGVSSSPKPNDKGSDVNNSNKETLAVIKQELISQTAYSTGAKAGFDHEPTRGSNYLFGSWVHGYAVNTGDSLSYDVNYLYNYDKITGDLISTQDKKTFMRVDGKGIKAFYLYDGKLFPHIFEGAPAINSKPFTEALVSTSKYKLYKDPATKLVPANFHTDGVIESGYRYDEYVDYLHYYFVGPADARPKQVSLKKKTLKEIFAGQADKFIAEQGSRDVDEDYIRELGYNLSQ